jgi:DNA-binding transcriptional ArsR family regulator
VGSDDLAKQLRLLTERVSRLESAAGPPAKPVDQDILERLAGGSGLDTIRYGGAGRWGEDTLAWQREHDWGDVRAQADDATARVLGALGNPVRLRIVAVLLVRPATTAELTEQLDQPSTGQLFHHLKELLTAGLIHQPVRGTYSIRRQDVIPVLAPLAAGRDLAASSVEPS